MKPRKVTEGAIRIVVNESVTTPVPHLRQDCGDVPLVVSGKFRAHNVQHQPLRSAAVLDQGEQGSAEASEPPVVDVEDNVEGSCR